MDRKALAQETLKIIKDGFYEIKEKPGHMVDIQAQQDYSVKKSFLMTPAQGNQLLEKYTGFSKHWERSGQAPSRNALANTNIYVWNCSAVEAILRLYAEEKTASVLNFASAKNPGGGFINGANAQEESLAVSSGLYRTLTVHEEYYTNNRACKSMMYTNYAIYSPNVVFFRDGRFQLMEKPVTASVLTIPAVNMGQVIQKGEDKEQAKIVMKERMKLILAIFAEQHCRHLVLGAYGCGVFRNDPADIAQWWKELLLEFFAGKFETVVFAVLDHSSGQKCIHAFEERFGKQED